LLVIQFASCIKPIRCFLSADDGGIPGVPSFIFNGRGPGCIFASSLRNQFNGIVGHGIH
jgi:hypothetical protein